MPLFWYISIFMWILLLGVLIDLYYYNNNLFIVMEYNNKYNINYLW